MYLSLSMITGPKFFYAAITLNSRLPWRNLRVCSYSVVRLVMAVLFFNLSEWIFSISCVKLWIEVSISLEALLGA